MFSCSFSLPTHLFCLCQFADARHNHLIPFDVHLIWGNKFWHSFAELAIKNAFINVAAESILQLRHDSRGDKHAEQQLKDDLLKFILLVVGDLRSVKINNCFQPTVPVAINQVSCLSCVHFHLQLLRHFSRLPFFFSSSGTWCLIVLSPSATALPAVTNTASQTLMTMRCRLTPTGSLILHLVSFCPLFPKPTASLHMPVLDLRDLVSLLTSTPQTLSQTDTKFVCTSCL